MNKNTEQHLEENRSRKTVTRESRRVRSASKKARRRLIVGILGGSVGLALIAGLFMPQLGQMGLNRSFDEGNNNQSDISVGTPVPIQISEVFDEGAVLPDYNVLPPTSGPKYATPAPWGVSEMQLEDGSIVANLESGGIIINHNLDNDQDISELTDFVRNLPGYPGCLVQTPHSAVMPASITLTAWGWTQTFDSLDPEAMEGFINSHINQGPLYFGTDCGLGS